VYSLVEEEIAPLRVGEDTKVPPCIAELTEKLLACPASCAVPKITLHDEDCPSRRRPRCLLPQVLEHAGQLLAGQRFQFCFGKWVSA